MNLGNTSTPSMVPKVLARPPISTLFNMPSPIQLSQNVSEASDVICENLQNNGANADEDNVKFCENDESESDHTPLISEDSADDTDIDNNVDTSPITSSVILEGNIRTCTNNQQETDKIARGQRSDKSTTVSNMSNILFVLVIIPCIIAYVAIAQMTNIEVPTVTIDSLKESFPQQDELFWKFIKTGVQEINNFEKPSVIIFMHKNGMSNITELLRNISMYASCTLNENCFVEPIVLLGKDLNTRELMQDYGVLIDKYRPLLEEKHIMIVRNMEEISGFVAQAFHYICDEYTPLVKKSLIIFTIEVDEYKGREIEQVVNILENKWSDVEQDKLEPLITRVSSVVLRIN